VEPTIADPSPTFWWPRPCVSDEHSAGAAAASLLTTSPVGESGPRWSSVGRCRRENVPARGVRQHSKSGATLVPLAVSAFHCMPERKTERMASLDGDNPGVRRRWGRKGAAVSTVFRLFGRPGFWGQLASADEATTLLQRSVGHYESPSSQARRPPRHRDHSQRGVSDKGVSRALQFYGQGFVASAYRYDMRKADRMSSNEARASGEAVIETHGLTKVFGKRVVVDGIDIAVPPRAVAGFVGPNGAGKTTTLRMLLGLIKPSDGSGRVLGVPLTSPAEYLSHVGARGAPGSCR
jgi:ABC-type multidrug transport system fused ATPase/permease subunit